MGIRVYGDPVAANVARVLVCLEEAGVEYELVPIDFTTAEHKGAAHLQRNPFGQVPAFQDGDLMLFESRAISRYVFQKYAPDFSKKGNLKESTMVDVWSEVEAHQYEPAIAPITIQLLVFPITGRPTDQKVVDESVQKLKAVLQVYETRLAKSKYLAGDFISFADLSHFPHTFYLMNATSHSVIFEDYPHVKAWWNDLMSRLAIQKVLNCKNNRRVGMKDFPLSWM